jgi:lysophospholipase L1-like esterase
MPSRPWLLLILALCLVLAVSLFLNVRLFRQAKGYYLEMNQARLDPLNLNEFVDEPMTLSEQPTVMFFGDSRAAAWPNPSLTTFHYVNRGIGAQTTTQVWGRYEAHVRPQPPAVLILQVGINDLKTIPLFPQNRQAIVDSTITHIEAIVAAATSQGSTVILTTIFPTGRVPLERQLFWSEDIAIAIQEVNAALTKMAGPNVILLDTHALLVDETGATQTAFYQDTLHLNSAGYTHLNQALIPLLQDLKRATQN